MSKIYSVIQIEAARSFENGSMQRAILMDAEGNTTHKYYPEGTRTVGEIVMLQDSTYEGAPCLKHVAVVDAALLTAMKAAKGNLTKTAAQLVF
jgi:hypothetical protein